MTGLEQHANQCEQLWGNVQKNPVLLAQRKRRYANTFFFAFGDLSLFLNSPCSAVYLMGEYLGCFQD